MSAAVDLRAANAVRAQEMADSAAAHDFSKGIWVPPATRARPPRNDGLEYVSEEEAFPNVPAPFQPLGEKVLVMLRVPKLQTVGGVRLSDDTERQTERDNMQVAKVIAIGPLAFHNRNTYEVWPEGAWFQVGEYVRVPKHQGAYSVRKFLRTLIEVDERTGLRSETEVEDTVVFAMFKDLAVEAVYRKADGSPDIEAALAERAFL